MTRFRTGRTPRRHLPLLMATVCCALVAAACAGSAPAAVDSTGGAAATATPAVETAATEAPAGDTTATEAPAIETPTEIADAPTTTFVAEVWADNWFALWANGELVAEDSVPITTERSFNAETITFEAKYPLTIAVEAKDFTETDSGLEYIGERNQQMGDGGIIVQITDLSTGDVVAVSDGSWAALVVHRAPLNVECESSANPDSECRFEIIVAPTDWAASSFDATLWTRATVWTSAAVSPKGGYDEIDWDPSAQLIWGSDLEVDNTVLLRTTVDG